MIPISCDGCGKNLKVKDEVAGKKVKCPGCGQVLRVPVLADSPSPAPDGKTVGGSEAGIEMAKTLPPPPAHSSDAATLPPVNATMAQDEPDFGSSHSNTFRDD